MTRTARAGQAVLTLLGLLCVLIAISVYFVPDPFDSDAQALVATFGAGMGLLVVVLAMSGLGAGSRVAWLALWVLPAFFVSHVALLGTWLPDGLFAVVATFCLVATRPRVSDTEREPVPIA